MNKLILEEFKQRLNKAIRNDLPVEAKYMYIGEIRTLFSLGYIENKDVDEAYKKLGLNEEELNPISDYLDFGEPEED
ncbi:MAG: hypothetical protein ACLFR2_06725 [Candidatus Kapaibacterium sp.]